jgi:hypothetical protein
MKKYLFGVIVLFLCFQTYLCSAQVTVDQNTQQQNQQQQTQTQQTPPATQEPQRKYEPYKSDEFPEWAIDLRRGEIITFGSFPITFFFVSEFYDLTRFFINNFQAQYAPWPLKDPAIAQYSSEEQIGVIIGALSLSVVIAVVDYIICKSTKPEKTPNKATVDEIKKQTAPQTDKVESKDQQADTSNQIQPQGNQ